MMASNLVKFGRYTLLGLVACGGMGEIYQARYDGVAGFAKTCIIKKIRREYARDKSFVDRFLDEGRLLVSLTHSNIVQIFDMGVVDGEYYLAMEYVDGADLRMLLRHIAPQCVPLSIAIGVCIEVLRGLSYAHRSKDAHARSSGIVHGDVSPSNILISHEGEVKLIDFGIARPARTHSHDDKVQGKLAYMSPEQAHGEALDCRTDIFSTGIVLFEMLAGRRPFGDNVEAMLCEGKFTCDLSIAHDVDLPEQNGEFDEILARSMAPSAKERYQTADEFSDDLIAYTRKYHLICGQKEVLSYFHRYIDDIAKSPKLQGSTDEVMSAALEAMIGMQSLGATRTRTLTPAVASIAADSMNRDIVEYPSRYQSITEENSVNDADFGIENDGKRPAAMGLNTAERLSDDSGQNSIDRLSDDSDQNSIDRLSDDSGQNSISRLSDDSGQNSISRLSDDSGQNSIDRLSGASRLNSGEELLAVDSSQLSRIGRLRRTLVKMRYMLIGAIGAITIISGIFFYRMSQSPVSLEALRQTLEAARLGNDLPQNGDYSNGAVVDIDDRTAVLPSDGEAYRSISASSFVYDAPKTRKHSFARGVPFAFYTEPSSATIYVVEGVYRDLEDKHFLLVAEQDTEVAIQAAGYETCFYRVHFDDIATRTLGNVSWRGCAGVESTFSLHAGQMQVLVHLNPIRAWRNDGDEQNIDSDQRQPQDNAEERDPIDNGARGVAEARTANRTRPRTSTPRAQELNEIRQNAQSAEKNSAIDRISARTNVRATLASADESCELPCTLDVPRNGHYEVRPRVSSRQIGVNYSATAQGDRNVSVDFCKMIVRIQESYVPGDPSPYQVADISIDERQLARQTDKATFILPCGTHEIKARTDTEFGRLEGSLSVDMTDRSKTHVYAISLSSAD